MAMVLLTTLLVTALTPGTSLAASLTEQLWETYDGRALVVLDTTDGRPSITTVDVDTRAEVRGVVEKALSRDDLVEWDAVVDSTGDTYQDLQWGIDDIKARSSWSMTAASVVVAVLDTGVNQHEDLVGRVLPGYNSWDSSTDVTDVSMHGTHVAGIIAANSNNNLGIAGVSANAVILPVKVLNDAGSGTTSSVANGLIWATDNGAKVVNLSLGGSTDSSVLRSAVDYADARGVLVIVAAGNQGVDSPTMYPAAYDNVIAVAATAQDRSVTSFSSRGSYVDVAAPGSAIASTTGTGTYAYMSGTSMAAPHVVAQAAVLAGLYPQSTAAQLRSYIESTLTDIDQPGRDVSSGGGLVDVSAAMQAAAASLLTPPGDGAGTPTPPAGSPDTSLPTPPGDGGATPAPPGDSYDTPAQPDGGDDTPLPAVSDLRAALQGPYVAVKASALDYPDVAGYAITRDGKLIGVFDNPEVVDVNAGDGQPRVYVVRAMSASGTLGDIAQIVFTPTMLKRPVIRATKIRQHSVTLTIGPVGKGQRVYVYVNGEIAYESRPMGRSRSRLVISLNKPLVGGHRIQVQTGTKDAVSQFSRTRTLRIKR